MVTVEHLRNQFTLNQLTKEDIPLIIALTTIIGWDYTPSDLDTIFESGIVFGHKTRDGNIISTAATFPYNNIVCSIGMVIVHSNYRGLGLGKAVTQACLDQFKGISAMLIATNEGIPLYKKMGFIKKDSLYKLIADLYQSTDIAVKSGINSRVFQESDFDEVVKLDEGAFGANREGFLKSRMKQSGNSIVLTDKKSKIIGFGLRVKLQEMILLGPVIAPDTIHAHYLIHTLINNHQGQVRIDIPSNKIHLVHQLIKCGFKIANQPPVMIMNTNELPNRNGELYGIAAQAFG